MRARQISIYAAKLVAGLAMSTLAWLALPAQGGDRAVSAAQTAEHKTVECGPGSLTVRPCSFRLAAGERPQRPIANRPQISNLPHNAVFGRPTAQRKDEQK